MTSPHRHPRPLRWLAIAFMVVCLAVQANAALVAGLLGPRHSHASADAAHDPMAGWRDFRRMQHAHPSVAVEDAEAAAHAHAHAVGMRHHHERDDPTVVQQEAAAGLAEGMPTDGGQSGNASLVFLIDDGAAAIAPPAPGRELVWRCAAKRALPDPHPRRIERPPQRT